MTPVIEIKTVLSVKEREREMLRKIKAKYPGELSWMAMSAAAEALGYLDYAEAWHNAMVGHGTWRPKVRRAAGEL